MLRRSLLILVCFLTACASGPTFIPDSYLSNMAASQFNEMKQQMPISKDPEMIAMAERVGKRIAIAAQPEMPNANWEIVVFDSDALNAFAMPGGKIGVFTGLIQLVDSEDELAAVMGHEVAHVMLEHSNQRMSAEVLRGAAGLATAYGTRNMDAEDQRLAMAAFGLGTQVGIMLPYSRSHESQADIKGLMLSARAGFDPRAAITFWQKMDAAGGSGPPEFLSTHPSNNTRIQNLNNAMPQAMAVYRQTRNQ